MPAYREPSPYVEVRVSVTTFTFLYLRSVVFSIPIVIT
jgi:hypothetical protein